MIISAGLTGKMEGIQGLTVAPCQFCEAMSRDPENVCHYCYSRQALNGYLTNIKPHYERNSHILSTEEIQPPRINAYAFRFNSHGELINRLHYRNLVSICNYNPRVTFALWTKRPGLVDLNTKPDNLILVLSSLKLNRPEPLPTGFDYTFTVYNDQATAPTTSKLCEGKCIDCLHCYTKGNNPTVSEQLK